MIKMTKWQPGVAELCTLRSLALAVGVLTSAAAFAQSSAAEWAVHAQNQYVVQANVTYLAATGYDSKLDIYRRRDAQAPQPTIVFFHGGGWIGGTKERALMSLMPWFEMGWNVVNVEYRTARVAQAPAALEDAICALRYVFNNAKDNNVDVNKIVVSGESAGGHLALAAGMIPSTASFASICAGGGFRGNETNIPRVAAIINWYGVTDLNDLLDGPNSRSYAAQWIGSGRDRNEVAKAVSPITYVRAGLPPILSIQGDADPVVPYSQNTRLHASLTRAGTPNELFTIPGGGHGNFKPEERSKAYEKIGEFLRKNGLRN